MTQESPAARDSDGSRAEHLRAGYDLEDLRVENRRLRSALEQMKGEILRLGRTLEAMHLLKEDTARPRGEAEQSLTDAAAYREQIEVLTRELHAVRGSLSWRWTRPLRWLRWHLSRTVRSRSAKLIPLRPRLPRKMIHLRHWSTILNRTLPRIAKVSARRYRSMLNTRPARELWSLEGPFDSSYSLAVVNREFARALSRAGELVALVSRDGPGRFEPNSTFLASNPDIDEMVRRAGTTDIPAVTFRDQYPPHVADMRGTFRILSNYAWEESGFPAAWVSEFNATLDLITVLSGYVAKVLRDNGVHVPIYVVGAGVDQMSPTSDSSAAAPREDGAFRFLHVSSCFPRKGVDLLLAAWGMAFTKQDPVELVIKTFPNIHNEVDTEIAAFRARHPDAAPITLINEDIEVSAMRTLYSSADAVVSPSRGEGFGLPLAEALALRKPVITTGHGGQTDFCTVETAWLCDYRFAYARTHLSVADSVWAEPDTRSLSLSLREVFEASPEERQRRVDAGWKLIMSRYTWDHVAQYTRSSVAAVRGSASNQPGLPVIGVISTWNSRCGIAAYTRSLLAGIGAGRLRVFANKVTEVLREDDSFVRRCWTDGWNDTLDELFQEVRAAHVDAVLLQFNFGFFRPEALKQLLVRLHAEGIPVFMTLHATIDVNLPGMTASLRDIRTELATACRLLVHSVDDLNRLKDIGLVDNVSLFPMGLPRPFAGDREAARRSLGLTGKTVVASFGYLLPHKGLPQLVRAFAQLRTGRPGVQLVMLNALYPVSVSDQEREACLDEARRLGVLDSITLITDFLDEADVSRRLAAADIVVFPYQHTLESSSAAVKMGLSSGTPVAVTPLPIFADIASVSHALPGMSSEDISDGLESLLADPARLATLADQQRTWITTHDWITLSNRLDGLIRGEVRARAASGEWKAGLPVGG